jgi:hypothetical protein
MSSIHSSCNHEASQTFFQVGNKFIFVFGHNSPETFVEAAELAASGFAVFQNFVVAVHRFTLVGGQLAKAIDVVGHRVTDDVTDEEEIWKLFGNESHHQPCQQAVADVQQQRLSMASVVNNVGCPESFHG